MYHREVADPDIRLLDLVELDAGSHHEEGLQGCLGDSYLCVQNPLFRVVRQQSLRHGCSFVPATDAGYLTAPLLALAEVLDTNTIPYLANRQRICDIVARCPTLRLNLTSLLRLFRRNVVLHESSHCLSQSFLSPRRESRIPVSNASEHVLTLLLSEAFAISLERIGACFAVSQVERALYALNSYVNPGRDSPLLQEAIRTCGFSTVLSAGMMAILYFSTHENDLSDEAQESILSLLASIQAVNSTDASMIRIIMKTSFAVNSRFRVETTPLFFEYIGHLDEYRTLTKTLFGTDTSLLAVAWENSLQLTRLVSSAIDLTGFYDLARVRSA